MRFIQWIISSVFALFVIAFTLFIAIIELIFGIVMLTVGFIVLTPLFLIGILTEKETTNDQSSDPHE